MKYRIAYHRGGLKECIETEKPISEKTAKKLIEIGIYEYYAYDERIKADRYILTNMEEDYNLPTWIHIYKN